jgi:large conductance mechanosensitive channel
MAGMVRRLGDGPMTAGNRARMSVRCLRRDPTRRDHGRKIMLGEFRDFIMRGNVVDLAVAVVIGGAFAAITVSLVEDIITPLLGLLGLPNFETWVIEVGDAEMKIGNFLNTLISFLAIAGAIFFLVVKPMNAINARRASDEEEEEAGPSEVDLLTEIRDELRKSA